MIAFTSCIAYPETVRFYEGQDVRRCRIASIFVLGIAGLLGCALATAAEPASGFSGSREMQASAKVMPSGITQSSSVRDVIVISRTMPRAIVLKRVGTTEVAAALRSKRAGLQQPIKTGFRRDLTELATSAATVRFLEWQTMNDGKQVAGISISSPGARSLRLGILVNRLPDRAIFRFLKPGSEIAREVDGSEVMAMIRRNQMSAGNSDQARTYWSPAIDGDTVLMEIELPADIGTEQVDIAVPSISHIVKSPVDEMAILENAKVGESGSCNIDVSCDAAWSSDRNAVVKISYVEDGSAYECSGTLVADSDSSSFIPYFLTAKHCIGNQAVASTLESNWFYYSTYCNSGVANGSSVSKAGGAELLYASTNTDTSFMRLAATPPSGAKFAAWSATAPTLGLQATSVHHPQGDLQKISKGSIDAFSTCTAPDYDGVFSCSPTSQSIGTFVNVTFTSGGAESGSSGSGLFKTEGGQHYLIGNYLGGSSSCNNPTGSNRYGRLDVAYDAALRQWLSSSIFTDLGEALDYSALTWKTGGNSTFKKQTATSYFGGSALQSGTLADSESTYVTTSLTGPAKLSFYWKVSSEAKYDFFSFYLDNNQQASISGETNWANITVDIPSGSHTVKWVYAKDESTQAGSDAAWLDRVQVLSAGITPSAGLWAIDAEKNGEPGRGFTIEVRNGVLVLTVFAYDASGGDAFYQAAGAMTGNNFTGTLNYYRNGTSLGGTFKSAVLAGSAGTVTIDFTSATQGTITLPGESAKTFSKFFW